MARRRGLTPTSFDQVRRILAKERGRQRDIYRPLSRVRIGADSTLVPLHRRFRVGVDEEGRQGELRLTPTALAQLTSIADIPGGFLERMPVPLALKVLRTMLEVSTGDADRSFLLRLREDTTPPVIRAVLPSSFVKIADIDLLDDLDQAIDRPVQIANLAVTVDSFSLRLIFPDERMNVGSSLHPDPTIPGLDLRSSETGTHPLQVRALLWRQVCKNGMTTMARAQQVLRKRMSGFDRHEFRAALHDSVGEAIDFGRRLSETLADTRSDFLDDGPQEIERIFRRYRLGSHRGDRARWVAAELARSRGLFGVGRFDVVQAFTSVARGLDRENRLRWEDAMTDYVMGGAEAV